MCGDSTNKAAVEKLMNGNKADICFTSPPYNAGSLNVKGQATTEAKYNSYDDNKSEQEYFEFIRSNMEILLSVANEVFYNIGLVENNKRQIIRLQNEFINQFKDIIYWKKSTVAPHIQPGVVNNLVEFILCFGNGKRKFENAQFSQGTYWNVIEGTNASGNEYSDIHKATFPIYLPSNIVSNFTPENGSVIDCFGGTGTTLIACEQLDRVCYMMELDPKYVDVIIDRWEKFTGEKAVLLNGDR
jgi:DNA modification methylase